MLGLPNFVVIPLFLVVSFALWAGLSAIVLRRSAWGELARRFPRAPETRVRTWRFRSGRVGKVGISGALTIGASPGYLHLGLLLFPGATPISIPWSALEVVATGRSAVLVAVDGTEQHLELTSRLWRAAQQAAGVTVRAREAQRSTS